MPNALFAMHKRCISGTDDALLGREKQLQKIITLRSALPAIVIVAVVALVAIAILFATHTLVPGTASGYPV
jgi:hypothetical protein